jgi:hypothetical protein
MEDGNDPIDLVVLLSRKLLSVWMHQQTYQREQDKLAPWSRECPRRTANTRKNST